MQTTSKPLPFSQSRSSKNLACFLSASLSKQTSYFCTSDRDCDQKLGLKKQETNYLKVSERSLTNNTPKQSERKKLSFWG